MTTVEPDVLRRVCGHWATGVAVVTGRAADGAPLGMAVNSFTSLSLDPPLVLFCPALASSTWPGIRAAGRFAVDVLATRHAALAGVFARSGGDKFAGVPLRETADGLPAIEGAVARLVCSVDAVHPGGDHEIVVGRVQHAEHEDDLDPLLFHRGRTPDYHFV
ncbi:flavin reductase family protein [Pseudonocardia sp. ICBG1034]|uniref:flavin reductase family protein n=1 Tax=Pseudonocardia sp. ICBG1034 TaxID=2844381 RepID=UPI001CCFBB10|nr:flavin reductase family protein [Pseudonocardia sp. ICBG1034]